jgi:hypothetical protein
MRYSKGGLELFKIGLKSSYFFASEFYQLVAGKNHLRFLMEEKYYTRDKVLTIAEELRFFKSVLVKHDDKLFCYDYKPCQVIELTKELKIVLIKCLAMNGTMSDADLEILFRVIIQQANIASKNEISVENYRLIDFFEWFDLGYLKNGMEIITQLNEND